MQSLVATTMLSIFGVVCVYSFIVNLIRFRISDLMILVVAFVFFGMIWSRH